MMSAQGTNGEKDDTDPPAIAAGHAHRLTSTVTTTTRTTALHRQPDIRSKPRRGGQTTPRRRVGSPPGRSSGYARRSTGASAASHNVAPESRHGLADVWPLAELP